MFNLIAGKFNLGFTGQPVAHAQHFWNFIGMVVVGLGSVMLGGCPLRQLIHAGEDNSDSSVAAIASMTTLNRRARDMARDLDVHAATDITGFSLSGHLSECTDASGTTIEVSLGSPPILPGVLDTARFGFIPEGRYTNEDYLFSKVSFPSGTPTELKDVAFGPETSGGLALFMPQADASEFISRMGLDCTRVIGRVVDRADVSVRYIP